MDLATKAASKWIGRTLADRYSIVGTLGAGGMADILRGIDQHTHTDVVIKVPKPAMLLEPDLVARFGREMRSMVKLAHPHIVRVIAVGEHDGAPFAVIEYMPKGTLRDRQTTTLDGVPVPMAASTLEGWLPPIAAVLDYIHSQGYVHRDMKPDNLLFDAQDKVYLADFGIVKMLDSTDKKNQTVATAAGMVIGTPEYMAPELILGKDYDGRIDQYALAVTVYEMLAGKAPFSGVGTAVHIQHCTAKVPPLTQIVPDLKPELWEAVSRGLAKDPRKRYPNCEALAREILACVASGGNRPAAPAPLAINTFRCPECKKRINLSAKLSGKRLLCTNCNATFEAPIFVEPVADLPGEREQKQKSSDQREPSRRAAGEKETASAKSTAMEPTRSRKSANRRRPEDEDYDEPRTRDRKRRDKDDSDSRDRPRRKEAKWPDLKKSKMIWLIGGGVALIGVILALTMGGGGPRTTDATGNSSYAAGNANSSASLNVSRTNLKLIAKGVNDYSNVYKGKLPENFMDKNGKALLSWRVQILPFIDQSNLYQQFKLNEPWDSANNIKLLALMPKIYTSPRLKSENAGYTPYVGFEGNGAVFSRGMRIGNIVDGISNTILCVESSVAVPWTKPDDLPFDPNQDVPDFAKSYDGVGLVAMVDGSVRTIDTRKISPTTLKNAINGRDGNVLGADW